MSDNAVRQEFERRLIDHFAAMGAKAFTIKPVVDAFLSEGDTRRRTSKTSCYRWASALIATGALHEGASRHLANAQAADHPIPDTRPADNRHGAFAVVANLEDAVRAARDVMASARALRHKPEQARLLIGAADVLRRCLDSAVRLREAIYNAETIDRFHSDIIETIREECPQAAARLMRRLEDIAHEYAAGIRH